MTKIRPLLFVVTILILAVSIFSFVFFQNVWLLRKWNIPIDPPGFLDSRQFAWASEAYAMGYDPLIENPVNPRGHQLNYPRIWHIFFHLGINESHTNIIGTIIVVLFLFGIGIFWFSKKFNNLTYLILFIVFLSPAVMLGVERSNIELILFSILALAILVNYYYSIPALLIFMFASVLKLYPVFGFIYLLKENKKRFWRLFLSAIGGFIIYGIISFGDFKQVFETTPKLVNSSFGIHVWWMGLRNGRIFAIPLSESAVTFFTVFSYILSILIVGLTWFYGMREPYQKNYIPGEHIDAFRVGAGIFIACFLLMNTHDYRLIFLIFTVPQLVAWLRDKERGVLFVPLITLVSIVLSMWNAFIMHFLGRKITFVIEEFCNWIILAGLFYLVISSLPDWFRDYLRRPYSGIKSINKTIAH
jgi:hypothetical protein